MRVVVGLRIDGGVRDGWRWVWLVGRWRMVVLRAGVCCRWWLVVMVVLIIGFVLWRVKVSGVVVGGFIWLGIVVMALVDIVRGMIRSNERSAFVLPRGLALAYTPEFGGSESARFVWSRRGVAPSVAEDRIMREAVRVVLDEAGLMALIGGPYFVGGVVVRDGWLSSVLTWRWVDSASLWLLEGDERERALAWWHNRRLWYED